MSATTRDWWRPELWLVLGIPAACVLGGAVTLFLVQGDLSADGEHEGVRRTAQVQTAELDPDLAASRAHLSASLRIDRARGEVRILLPDSAAAQAGLELSFVHALHADRDLREQLRARDGGWIAAQVPAADSRWRVVLSDPAHRWRLVGTLPRDGAELALHPALAAP